MNNTFLILSFISFFIAIGVKYKKNLFFALIDTIVFFLYLFITLLYFIANYFTDEGINRAVIYTLKYSLRGAGFGEYLHLIIISILIIAIFIYFSYKYFRQILKEKNINKKSILLHNAFYTIAIILNPFTIDLLKIYKNQYSINNSDFKQFYIRPLKGNQKNNGLNIVYIYAESLEKTYFNESIFPNLLPNLTKLKKEAIEFSDINQIVGSGWTIGGMVSSQCGIPLFTPASGNSYSGVNRYLSGAICLGDILKNSGYKLIFLEGTSAKFSGQDKFYKTHSFDEIVDKEILIKKLKDKSYINAWGLYDDSMLKFAYEKFINLSENGKKFALFIATMDTHHPSGYHSKSCSKIFYKDGSNSILNAVHCSDLLISDFIQKIKNSKYANNTLIVITSDHLAIKNDAYEFLNKVKRKDLFLIIEPNSKIGKVINKKGSMLDISPTILYKLGINTNLGLGRNLFKEESLIYKFKDFNNKLNSWWGDIVKLWEFTSISKDYEVNLDKKEVFINKTSYKFPVLFKLKKDNTLIPFFNFDTPIKISSYLKKFKIDDKFIWIDKCVKFNYLFNAKFNEEFCVAQGVLGGEVNVYKLDKSKNISVTKLFSNNRIDKQIYTQRLNKLKNINLYNRYFAYELPSNTGEVKGKYKIAIENKDKKGFITYGPYIRLSRGKYLLDIHYLSDYNNSYDISLDCAKTILYKGNLKNTNLKDYHLKKIFNISSLEDKKELEVRVYFNAKGKLIIKSITITPYNKK